MTSRPDIVAGDGKRTLYYALAAAFVAFALYTSALNGEFIVGDDFGYVKDNPAMKLPPREFVRWAFTTVDLSTWHPLTWISFRIDYALWGMNPKGYHLTSALLHALNTLLVTLLFSRLIRTARGPDDALGSDMAALAAGLVFAAHPALVESVAWISGRKVLLYAAFWLGAAHAYISYARHQKPWAYGASLALFACALMCQPMAATLPLALLVLNRYPLQRPWRRCMIELIPFAVLSIASASVTYAAFHETLIGMTPLSWGYKSLNAVRALGHYMAKAVAPVGLSAFYPQPMGGSAVNAGHVWAAVAVLTASLTALLLKKKYPAVLAGWLVFVASLLPVLGIVPVGLQAAADRYMYIAIIGPLGLICLAALRYLPRGRIVAAALIAALCVMSLMQVRVWRSGFTLWGHVRELYPNDAQPYAGLGLAAMAAGRTDEALGLLDQAVNIEIQTVSHSPRLHWLYSMRADALMSRGENEKAVIDYTAALRLKDSYDIYFMKRARAYSAMGEWDRAVSDLKRATAIRPGGAEAWGLLGAAYLKRADYQNASEALTRALALRPHDPAALHASRAEAYMGMGRTDEAANDMRAAGR